MVITQEKIRLQPMLEDSLEAWNSVRSLQDSHLLQIRNSQYFDLERRVEAFLSITNHDLRGPLARILGLVTLLKHSPSDTDHSLLLESLEESAKSLDAVIKEMNDSLMD